MTLGRDADLPAQRSAAVLEARAHELLDAARELGIDYVDVARSYGLAEQFLRSWLEEADGDPFVASTWGYRYTAGWRRDADQHEVKDHSLALFVQQWAETDRLLGRWLRLYQVHSLTSDSPLWENHALLDALAHLRDQGCEIGFSTSGPAQADAVRRGLELAVQGRPLFTSVQSTWTLLERSVAPALEEAAACRVRVVVEEALANGRLALPGPATVGLERAARDHRVGLDALAIAADLTQPWADVVLRGAVTVPQLTSNAEAGDPAGEPGLDTLVAPQAPAEYWAERSRLSRA
jgi:aryl-alcohol dehydrogenase-like predicted oxidoreductase